MDAMPVLKVPYKSIVKSRLKWKYVRLKSAYLLNEKLCFHKVNCTLSSITHWITLCSDVTSTIMSPIVPLL